MNKWQHLGKKTADADWKVPLAATLTEGWQHGADIFQMTLRVCFLFC